MTHIEQDSILYSPSLVQQRRGGVCLLIDPDSPNWASTSTAGSAIVRRCDGHHTLREICQDAGRDLGIEPGIVASFVSEAAEAGLISTAPRLEPAYKGRGEAIAPGSLEELWISTNNSCPLRCRHCLVNGGTDAVRPLTAPEIQKLVDDAIALGVTRFYFTGGEPFMRKDLFSLIKHVTDRASLVILTSGTLMSRERAARLKSVANGRLLVQVSLEGPDRLTNDAIRGEGNFDLALQGIRRLVDAGLPPIVTTTLTKLNYRKAAETTRFVASLGVKDHHVLWLHARGRMRQNSGDLLLEGSVIARVMEELKLAARDNGILVDNSESLAVRVKSKRGRKNDLCNCCYGVLSVNTEGHVYPCAALSGAEEFDCGSIKEKSLKDIWLESPIANWVRQNSVQKRVGCSACFLKYFCGGGCFAQSYFDYEMTKGSGCIMAPDPYCEAYKSQIMELMWEAALPDRPEQGGQPVVYRHMGNELPGCAAGGSKVLNAAFDVGTYHCACVLAMDAKENAR
ncbi:MAG: radical SAM protein [Dehalococcoidia bacterium]|nr:radical SAM protein [Dehalococcoidia bacterium]